VNAAAVLAAARAELGTVESPPNSNRTKYGQAYGWNGVAWCAIWCWYVFGRAGAAALIPKTASTVAMRDWYRARGQWHTSRPQTGDLVFFRFAGNNNPVNHVGLVEAVEPNGALITIEGNTAGTNAGDQRNGGGVYRKRRAASIVGFARPAYATAPASAPHPPGGGFLMALSDAEQREILEGIRRMKPGQMLPGRSQRLKDTLDDHFGWSMTAAGRADDTLTEIRGLRATIDQLAAIVDQLATIAGQGGGATADEIRAAVTDAIRDGLVEVDITVRGQTTG
jgi:hypothetical protein